MEMLKVSGLTKRYDKFELKDVSFSLERGYIMGFIGRNGAGKTTTLKSMLGFVHKDAGSVTVCGCDFDADEFACKQKIGFMMGGIDCFPRRRLRDIAGVTRRFYSDWDDAAYLGYLKRFDIDDAKRVSELSSGMKVKFNLALALSHKAQLLILDEPTSGLDPVSRDDMIELFQELIEDGQHSILFSTHITSDLDKCADYVTYIRNGSIVESMDKDTLLQSYRVVKGETASLTPERSAALIGVKAHAYGFTALVRVADMPLFDGFASDPADIESIMIYSDKEGAEL